MLVLLHLQCWCCPMRQSPSISVSITTHPGHAVTVATVKGRQRGMRESWARLHVLQLLVLSQRHVQHLVEEHLQGLPVVMHRLHRDAASQTRIAAFTASTCRPCVAPHGGRPPCLTAHKAAPPFAGLVRPYMRSQPPGLSSWACSHSVPNQVMHSRAAALPQPEQESGTKQGQSAALQHQAL